MKEKSTNSNLFANQPKDQNVPDVLIQVFTEILCIKGKLIDEQIVKTAFQIFQKSCDL